jgi:hypothetical protein
MYGHQLFVAPSGNYRQVRLDLTLTGWKSIHRNSERHVRMIATGRHPHQRIVTAQSSQ